MTDIPRNEKLNEDQGDLDGVLNSKKLEPVPTFVPCAGEKVVAQNGNAFIVMGRDRPVGCGSGYGSQPVSRASAIDIVVGRQGHAPNSQQIVENNFGTLSYNNRPGDAARIYISQKTDVDENFGIKQGKVGFSKEKAAIGLIADDVRVIARRGIKLVTGGPKQSDSLNKPTNAVLGVDIMAGNLSFTSKKTGRPYLQPMVKGLNLLECLGQIVDEIQSLNAVMQSFITKQTIINTSINNSAQLGVGNLGAPVVAAIDPVTSGIVESLNTQIISDSLNALTVQSNFVLTYMKTDHLAPSGNNYICSRYNRVN